MRCSIMAQAAVIVSAMVVIFLLASKGEAHQTIADTMEVSDSELGNFSTCMTSLAKKYPVRFLVDDLPFVNNLSDNTIVTLREQLHATKSDSGKSLTQIAFAYDYDLKEHSPGVFLLHKRYSAPEDLPMIPVPEMRAFLKNVSAMGNRLLPSYEKTETLRVRYNRLLEAFPEEDNDRLVKGIPFNELSDAQKALVVKYCYDSYLGNLIRVVDRSEELLSSIPKRQAAFCWNVISGITMFEVQYSKIVPTPSGGTTQGTGEYILSHGAMSSIMGGTIFPSQPTNATSLSPILSDQADPTAPTTDPDLAPSTNSRNSHSTKTITLAEAFKDCAKRANKENIPVIEIDPSIADKPLIFIGNTPLEPIQRLKAVAELYGLRIVQAKENQFFLTTPRFTGISKIADLPKTLQRLIPTPIVHAWLGKQQFQGHEVSKSTEFLTRFGSLPPDIQANVRQSRAGREVSQSFRIAAIRALRQKVQHRVPKPEGRLLVRDSGREAVEILSLLPLTDIMPEVLKVLYSPVPEYMLNPEASIATGGKRKTPEGRWMFRMDIYYLDDKGRRFLGPNGGMILK